MQDIKGATYATREVLRPPITHSMLDRAKALTDTAMQDQMDEVGAAHSAYKTLRMNYLCERDEVHHSYLEELRRQAK